MTSLHGSFPDLALLLLAVAHDAEDLVLLAVEFGGQREADGDAQTLAERARRCFDTGQLQPVGMSLIGRAQLAQRNNVVDGAEAGECQA